MGWLHQSESDVPFSFANASSGEELVVTVLENTRPLERDEMEISMRGIIRQRIRAWGAFPSHSMTRLLQPPQTTAWPRMQACLVGIDRPERAYLQFAVVGCPKRFVLISYCRHNSADISVELTRQAGRVIERCLIHPE
jgi:hypothetical protein